MHIILSISNVIPQDLEKECTKCHMRVARTIWMSRQRPLRVKGTKLHVEMRMGSDKLEKVKPMFVRSSLGWFRQKKCWVLCWHVQICARESSQSNHVCRWRFSYGWLKKVLCIRIKTDYSCALKKCPYNSKNEINNSWKQKYL